MVCNVPDTTPAWTARGRRAGHVGLAASRESWPCRNRIRGTQHVESHGVGHAHASRWSPSATPAAPAGRPATPAAPLSPSISLSPPVTASTAPASSLRASPGNLGIQPGDSGGSLVNTAGQVIGIDTAASQSYSSQGSGTEGFAIPVDQALAVARQIESGRGSTTVHVGPTAFLGVLLSASSAQSGPDNLFGNSTVSSGGSSPSSPTVSSVVSGGPGRLGCR